MTLKDKLERNIILLYIGGAMGWGRFFIPVLALFYIASEVPFEQFTIIMGTFSLVILLLEVPSGVIADLIGKKNAIMMARFLYIFEVVIIAFFNGFWAFFIAKIISGVGVSLRSGAAEALMYDSLKRLDREDDHKRVSGVAHMISNIFQAFVFIIGAVLFTIHPKLPAKISIPFMVLNFIFVFFMTEPYAPTAKATIKNSWKHLKEGIAYVKGHSYVKYIIFLSLPIVTALDISKTVSSVYLEVILIPIYLLGVIAFISQMISAYVTKKAYKIEEWFGEKNSIQTIQLYTIVAVFLLALMIPFAGAVYYLVLFLISGFFYVIINHYINVHIPTSHRATVLSIKNLSDNGGYFILLPIFGFTTKAYDLQFSFIALGIFLVIYLIGLHIYKRSLGLTKIENEHDPSQTLLKKIKKYFKK